MDDFVGDDSWQGEPDGGKNELCKQILPWCAKITYLVKQFCVHVQEPPTQHRPTNARKVEVTERFVESVLALRHVSAMSSEIVYTTFW